MMFSTRVSINDCVKFTPKGDRLEVEVGDRTFVVWDARLDHEFSFDGPTRISLLLKADEVRRPPARRRRKMADLRLRKPN